MIVIIVNYMLLIDVQFYIYYLTLMWNMLYASLLSFKLPKKTFYVSSDNGRKSFGIQ